MLTLSCISDLSHSVLTCQPYSTTLYVFAYQYSTFGTHTFSVARPRVWNSLLDHLWDPAAAVDPNNLGET